MRNLPVRIFACCLPMVLWAVPAAAYVGPGAGITLVGALWGVLIAVGAAVGFLILWPLRKMFVSRGRRGGDGGAPEQPDQAPAAKSGRS